MNADGIRKQENLWIMFCIFANVFIFVTLKDDTGYEKNRICYQQ